MSEPPCFGSCAHSSALFLHPSHRGCTAQRVEAPPPPPNRTPEPPSFGLKLVRPRIVVVQLSKATCSTIVPARTDVAADVPVGAAVSFPVDLSVHGQGKRPRTHPTGSRRQRRCLRRPGTPTSETHLSPGGAYASGHHRSRGRDPGDFRASVPGACTIPGQQPTLHVVLQDRGESLAQHHSHAQAAPPHHGR